MLKKFDSVSLAQRIQSLDVGEVLVNEPLSKHTTWQIGGPCDLLITPHTTLQLQRLIAYAYQQDLPVQVLGRGSNLLVSDQGLRGLVIKLQGGLTQISCQQNILIGEAGVLIKDFAAFAATAGLSGLEFAEGIPGTLGGGVVMNAGAYGHHLAEVIRFITYCDQKGQLSTLTPQSNDFAYRQSLFQKDKGLIIVAITCQLQPANTDDIQAQMAIYHQKRQSKQPLDLPSAGSTFKNPPGQSVAKLIESVGAKGWRVGDAQVSPMHSNFLINLGNATSADVLTLMDRIQQAVLLEHGIQLEPEIIFLR